MVGGLSASAPLLLVAVVALQCLQCVSKQETVILKADGSVEQGADDEGNDEDEDANERARRAARAEADGGVVVTTKHTAADGSEVVNVEAGGLIVPGEDLFKRALKEHQSGNYKKAIKQYEMALEAGECTPDLYNNLALALKSKGKCDEAKEVYEKGVELFPGHELLETNRDVIMKPPRLKFEKMEGVEGAKDMKHAGELMFKRGVELHKQGKKNEAMDYYVQAESANNMIPDLFNNLALLYSEMNWPQKACETWNKGNMLWPEHELLQKNRHIIFGGPDGECGKRRILEIAGAPGAAPESRYIAPPQYAGL